MQLDKEGVNQVIAASLDTLIDAITPRLPPDDQFITHFLYVYPYAVKSTALLRRLERRWFYLPPDDASESLRHDYARWRYTIRMRVWSVLRKWLFEHPYYFSNRKLYESMATFLETHVRRLNLKMYDEVMGQLLTIGSPKLASRFNGVNKSSEGKQSWGRKSKKLIKSGLKNMKSSSSSGNVNNSSAVTRGTPSAVKFDLPEDHTHVSPHLLSPTTQSSSILQEFQDFRSFSVKVCISQTLIIDLYSLSHSFSPARSVSRSAPC